MVLGLIIAFTCAVFIASYFLVRLHWVKMFQTTILMRSPPAYMALPNYKTMLWRKFWVWDDTEFLPDPDCLRRE